MECLGINLDFTEVIYNPQYYKVAVVNDQNADGSST